MSRKPKPLTPKDCDLRGLPYMPLHGERLIDSDFFFIASGDEFKAALALWWASWKQVPAASLPTDPRVLAGLAKVGDGTRWEAVKESALHGWILCSDGRLYHPVVAEFARTAWDERQEHLSNKESETERKRREREERRHHFAGLKLLNIHLPWNTPMADLRRAAADNGLPPVPNLSGGQVADKPATVTAIEGKGKQKGVLEGSNDPSLSAGKPPRARSPKRLPEERLPENFPWPELIAMATEMIGEAGVTLNAEAHANRFRSHAKTTDRRARDWTAAWVAWIEIEIEKAPAAPARAAPVASTWNGPDALSAAIAAEMGADRAGSYLGRCVWGADRTVVAPNGFVADALTNGAPEALAANDAQVVVAGRAVA